LRRYWKLTAVETVVINAEMQQRKAPPATITHQQKAGFGTFFSYYDPAPSCSTPPKKRNM